jgi:cellulose synthase/poly-beta-1,6-N-acetylglucosamine synthase-like glycosyltransferase
MAEDKMNPKVSILVPAWNEGVAVKRVIESFLSLKYPGAELIVAAGGGNNTYELAKKYEGERVRVLRQERRGKNRALNMALSKARGDIIVLTDADCVMSDEWLSSLLEAIRKGEEAVSGTNMPLQEQLSNPLVLYQYSFTLAGLARASGKEPYLDGKNAALKRSVLEDLGGFDEEALTGTDFSLKLRLLEKGIIAKFVPNSVIATHYPSSFRAYLSQQARWLRNFAIYGAKYRDAGLMRVFLEQTFIASFVLLAPVFAVFFKPLIAPWLAVFSLGIYNRARIIRKAGKIKPALSFTRVYPRLPLYLLVEYLSRAIALFEYLVPSLRRKW